ncbi:MAG: beta-methylgalactoside transporter permease, partial [Oscillospiraceae bacterium]
MRERHVPYKKFAQIFMLAGAVVALFGGLLLVVQRSFAPNLQKKIFDMPILMVVIGACILISGVVRRLRSTSMEGSISITRTSVKSFLTSNAILLALLALVVVICFIQPRFMQVRVVLDILTQSSTRL